MDQMMETIRMGDDGLEDVIEDISKEFSLAIKEFEIFNLTVIEPKPKVEYLKRAELLQGKSELSSGENLTIYKSKLYTYIKRKLREKEIDYSPIKNDQLFMFFEGCIIIDSEFQDLYYSKEWFYASVQVIQDIVDEIVEHRKLNPQQTLFK